MAHQQLGPSDLLYRSKSLVEESGRKNIGIFELAELSQPTRSLFLQSEVGGG